MVLGQIRAADHIPLTCCCNSQLPPTVFTLSFLIKFKLIEHIIFNINTMCILKIVIELG